MDMRCSLFCLLLLLSLLSRGQDWILVDSALRPALSPMGSKNPNCYVGSFTGKSAEGKTYSRDSLTGKIAILNFWFESCLPCISEFKSLNSLYNKFKDNPDFLFLSFTFDGPGTFKKVIRDYHLEFPVVSMSENDIRELIFNLGFPTTIITDKTGKITFIKCGGFNDEEHAGESIDTLFVPEIQRLLSSK